MFANFTHSQEEGTGMARQASIFPPSEIPLDKLAAWCQDGITMLSENSPYPEIVEVQRETVRELSADKRLLQVAEDIAVRLGQQPDVFRKLAHEQMMNKHGFSFDSFSDEFMKKISSIFRRKKIISEDELRLLIEFSGDQANDTGSRRKADQLISEWEMKYSKNSPM